VLATPSPGESGVRGLEDAMRTYPLGSSSWTIRKAIIGVFGWPVAGAVAAGLYGLLYGTLRGLLHADLGGVLLTAGYFALCGGAAGAILAVCVRLLDLATIARPEATTDNAILMGRAAFTGPTRLTPFHPTRRVAFPTGFSGNSTRVGDPSLN
jgi:hypothetical protein